VTRKKLFGMVVIALFLLATAGVASAAELDLPKWVIVPEDLINFSDVTLFCGLDAMDTTNNVTPCYYEGSIVNATIYFNSTTGYPKLVTGKIGNAFEFDGNGGEAVKISGLSIALDEISINFFVNVKNGNDYILHILTSDGYISVRTTTVLRLETAVGTWYKDFTEYFNKDVMITLNIQYDANTNTTTFELYLNDDETPFLAGQGSGDLGTLTALAIGSHYYTNKLSNMTIDEFRIYTKTLTPDERKLLYYAGRKKLSEPAQFRQIFSPLIDLTEDRATSFYADLEVSTSDPNGYVPVPESAVNMSITSAEKLKSDYTGYEFYYQGHYWYKTQKVQFDLPVRFETVREKGSFDKVIILDEDQKTYVYEKEFRIINPTATKINVIYSVDPVDLGFSILQYPEFELDGIRMVSWQPQNSTELKLIRTDTLEPGEISTHWIKSTWTLSKEELEFPAKLEDFRSILDWQTAQKLAENAAKGKGDTYVKVIKISSNADVSNVTIYVPLKDVEDESDVVEAVALTGSRATLQVEELDDGTIAVKVPADAFVSGEAEVKVFYNKETSWWKSILDRIKSMVQWIKSIFGFGGG